LTRDANVFARVEPLQKLGIVESLARNGHVVAVTGDGVNDAPALKHAHVGVAMGRNGTDIARESADVILTDDNFASIVAGIREGRVAYANIRKVVFMLVATGAAEVLLFLATVPFGLPIPLLAVQLLWLNLVTNGIQDVMLAAEKAEGDELAQPPRRPGDPLFDRIMVRRIVLSAALMAVSGVGLFIWQLNSGVPLESVRNQLLLQFVIFENVLTLCARSERSSVLGRNFFRNPLLLGGVVVTQLLHAAAMYLPALSGTLEIEPISPSDWAILIAPALLLMAVLELDKYVERRRTAASDFREATSR
jgi:Ca2+-transporting ATPase